jgi:hypothetical protein
MIPITTAQAITWTKAEPAYSMIDREQIASDIRTLLSWSERERDLSAICQYAENWDGLDSAPPDPAVIARAGAYLRLLKDQREASPPLRISLSPDGVIAMEWLEGQQLIRAEIGNTNEIEWMMAQPGKPTEYRVEIFGEDSVELRGHEWQPAPPAADEPAYASAH